MVLTFLQCPDVNIPHPPVCLMGLWACAGAFWSCGGHRIRPCGGGAAYPLKEWTFLISIIQGLEKEVLRWEKRTVVSFWDSAWGYHQVVEIEEGQKGGMNRAESRILQTRSSVFMLLLVFISLLLSQSVQYLKLLFRSSSLITAMLCALEN